MIDVIITKSLKLTQWDSRQYFFNANISYQKINDTNPTYARVIKCAHTGPTYLLQSIICKYFDTR